MREKNKTDKVSKNDQNKEYTMLSYVIQTIKLQAAQAEKDTAMDNNILPGNERLLLKKTNRPKNNDIMIDGQ
jgi:hypothetical protein